MLHVLVVAALLGPMEGLAAPEATPLRAGMRVRVTAPTIELHRRPGQLAEIRPDTLYIAFERDVAARPIPLAELLQVEVSRGRFHSIRRGALGGLIGLGAGAGLGALLGQRFLQNSQCSDCLGAELGAAIGGGAGLLLGFGGGIAIPRERWTPVPLPR